MELMELGSNGTLLTNLPQRFCCEFEVSLFRAEKIVWVIGHYPTLQSFHLNEIIDMVISEMVYQFTRLTAFPDIRSKNKVAICFIYDHPRPFHRLWQLIYFYDELITINEVRERNKV
jgi:hypothetical protein